MVISLTLAVRLCVSQRYVRDHYFPPTFSITVSSICDRKIIEERTSDFWRTERTLFFSFRLCPMSDPYETCSLPLFLFFFKVIEVVGFYRKKKKKTPKFNVRSCLEGVLFENGVQPSEQLFRISAYFSGPIPKWAMQFAFSVSDCFFFPPQRSF